MDEKNKAILDDNWLKELPIRSETLGFGAEEMLKCGKCGRSNPPNRLNCFYCAEGLEIAGENLARAKPNPRRLESWEKGFNVIASRSSDVRDNLAAIASEAGLELDAVGKIFSAHASLPLARVENERVAELLCLRLTKLGIEAKIVSDDALSLDRVQRRIRGLEFQGETISAIDFNTRENISIPASDILLIVAGTLFEVKTTSFETRKKNTSKLLEQSETSADELVLDLYTRQDHAGFRIYERGFDFSCLGEAKSLFASENMPKLARKLIAACPHAKLDENYTDLQEVLAIVWELESHKDVKGLRRSGFGKAHLANVVTVNNQTQFDRYSRLLRYLYEV